MKHFQEKPRENDDAETANEEPERFGEAGQQRLGDNEVRPIAKPIFGFHPANNGLGELRPFSPSRWISFVVARHHFRGLSADEIPHGMVAFNVSAKDHTAPR